MPNLIYNVMIVTGPPKDLRTFYESFKGHHAYYWVSEKAFRPYPMEPNKYLMDGPALKGETYIQYNLRMENELLKQPKIHCMNALYPVPEKVRKNGYSSVDLLNLGNRTVISSSAIDGRQWQNTYWGTKWDLVDVVVHEESDSKGIYEFTSAWNYPRQWIIYASKKFPNLRFDLCYDEEAGFIGVDMYQNGRQLVSISESNSDSMKHHYIYAHIFGRIPSGKFRDRDINTYVLELAADKDDDNDSLQWVIDTYNDIKTIDIDKMHVPYSMRDLPFSKRLLQEYTNDLKKAFGDASIALFNEKKKEIEKLEKVIDTIRLDLRGSHIKLVVA